MVGINIGLFGNFRIQGQIPNLPLLFLIFFCLGKKDYDFFLVAFFSGFVLDCYSTSFFGGFTLSFLFLAMGFYYLLNYFLVFELNWKSLTSLLLGALLFVNLFLWLYNLLAVKFGLTDTAIAFRVLMGHFFIQFLYSWLLLYPIYLLFNFISKAVDNLIIKRRGFVR